MWRPALLLDLLRRARAWSGRHDIEGRMEEEIRFHIDMATARHERRGMSPDEARRAALLAFGGRERWKEAARDEVRNRPLEDALSDLRYAARTLRKSPAFTLTAVLTLAVGIGANTAIFSAVDGALLKPLPYPDPGRLLTLWQVDARKGIERDQVTPANFLDWRERARSFTAIAAAEPYSLDIGGPDGPEMVRNWNVSDGFFEALGVHALLGRTFAASDFQTGRERVLVISYASWQRRFGGARDIIGRRLLAERAPSTIVGVLPPHVGYPEGREFWSTKVFTDEDRQTRGSAFYRVIARLRPGVSADGAAAEMRTIAAQLAREQPRTNTGVGVRVIPLAEYVVGGARPGLLVLLGAVGLVLLIACANVANLLLARTARRGRELAIRAALGAGRGRVVRQLLAESLLLALVGAAAGVLLASWCVTLIRRLGPANLPRVAELKIDARALAFALVAGILTAVLFGLTPALRAARADLQQMLRGGRAVAGTGRPHGLRRALVAGEVALAVLLLVGAGLLVRSFITLLTVERGYRSDHVLTANVFIWQWNETAPQRVLFIERVVGRLRAIPGVSAAGATSALPVAERIGPAQGKFSLVGQPIATSDASLVHVSILTPGVFDVLRIPLRTGRLFGAADDAAHAPVAVINQAMARRHWPAESPIGKRILLRLDGPPQEREIVGVVGDIRQTGLETAPQPALYIPHAQSGTGSLTLVLRTRGEPGAALPAVRRALAELNPELPLATGVTLDALLDDSLRARRFNLMLLGSFALTALVLAVVGVYGMLAQEAAERRQEIGVRLALGAGRAAVLRLVMRQGLAPAALGIAGGLLAAGGLTRVLHGMLYQITPLDTVTYVGVALGMLATAAMGCWLPAWRAARIDPLVALRGD